MEKKMNILCLNHEYPPIGGGGATACSKITEEYVKSGHDVTIVTAKYKSLPEKEVINGVNIVRVPCKRSKQHSSSFVEMFSFLRLAFFETRRIMKERKFDVIHVFFGIPSGPIGYYYSKKYKIPYIVRLGGGDIPGRQKRFKYIYKILNPGLKAIWQNASCVIANSNGLLESAESCYDNVILKKIPNGISTDDFNGKAGFNNEVLTLCTTARIIEGKGLHHIIELLPDLRKETGDKVKYTIIGDGPLKDELFELAKSLKVDDIVEFTGFLNRDEVLKKLVECDVFVLPSYREGMPNVVLEAMASGLPVVMTNCGGSEELIDETNGFIVPLDTDITQGFRDILIKLSKDKSMLKSLGENGYKKVMNNYTWSNAAQQYIELLEDICDYN